VVEVPVVEVVAEQRTVAERKIVVGVPDLPVDQSMAVDSDRRTVDSVDAVVAAVAAVAGYVFVVVLSELLTVEEAAAAVRVTSPVAEVVTRADWSVNFGWKRMSTAVSFADNLSN
jgi:hypothetical protein